MAQIVRSEPSIVPCLIIIPPPNFQKKSEILKKTSDNNPTPNLRLQLDRFAVPSSATELEIWKTVAGIINHVVYQQSN